MFANQANVRQLNRFPVVTHRYIRLPQGTIAVVDDDGNLGYLFGDFGKFFQKEIFDPVKKWKPLKTLGEFGKGLGRVASAGLWDPEKNRFYVPFSSGHIRTLGKGWTDVLTYGLVDSDKFWDSRTMRTIGTVVGAAAGAIAAGAAGGALIGAAGGAAGAGAGGAGAAAGVTGAAQAGVVGSTIFGSLAPAAATTATWGSTLASIGSGALTVAETVGTLMPVIGTGMQLMGSMGGAPGSYAEDMYMGQEMMPVEEQMSVPYPVMHSPLPYYAPYAEAPLPYQPYPNAPLVPHQYVPTGNPYAPVNEATYVPYNVYQSTYPLQASGIQQPLPAYEMRSGGVTIQRLGGFEDTWDDEEMVDSFGCVVC